MRTSHLNRSMGISQILTAHTAARVIGAICPRFQHGKHEPEIQHFLPKHRAGWYTGHRTGLVTLIQRGFECGKPASFRP